MSSWEERMSQQAKARMAIADEQDRELQARLRQERLNAGDAVRRVDRPWLNGWGRMGGGTTVLIGSGIHCVGCGRFFGICSIVIDENWTPPDKDPDWPFGLEDCAVCYFRYLADQMPEPPETAGSGFGRRL